MTDIVIAQGDYWMGLYVNGRLKTQEHTVSLLDFGELLMDNQPINSVTHKSVDLDWLDDEGELPLDINDIKWNDE